MSETMTIEWLDSLPGQLSGKLARKAMAFLPGIKDSFDELTAAIEQSEGVGESSPEELAVNRAREDDPDSLAELDATQDKLGKARSLLAQLTEQYNTQRESVVGPYIDAAREESEQLKGNARESIADARKEFKLHLKMITKHDEDITVPTIPGQASAASADGETAWRPDLDSATINKAKVEPINGQYPTCTDIHRTLVADEAFHGTVRDLSVLLGKLTGRKFTDGKAVAKLTSNGTEYVVALRERKESEKPKRGRAAK